MAKKKPVAEDAFHEKVAGFEAAPAAEPNYSQLIRDVIGDKLDMKPKEVVEELAKRGITLKNEGLINQVKTAMKKKAGVTPATRGKKVSSGSMSEIGSMSEMLALVKKAADAVGGMKELAKIADTLK